MLSQKIISPLVARQQPVPALADRQNLTALASVNSVLAQPSPSPTFAQQLQRHSRPPARPEQNHNSVAAREIRPDRTADRRTGLDEPLQRNDRQTQQAARPHSSDQTDSSVRPEHVASTATRADRAASDERSDHAEFERASTPATDSGNRSSESLTEAEQRIQPDDEGAIVDVPSPTQQATNSDADTDQQTASIQSPVDQTTQSPPKNIRQHFVNRQPFSEAAATPTDSSKSSQTIPNSQSNTSASQAGVPGLFQAMGAKATAAQTVTEVDNTQTSIPTVPPATAESDTPEATSLMSVPVESKATSQTANQQAESASVTSQSSSHPHVGEHAAPDLAQQNETRDASINEEMTPSSAEPNTTQVAQNGLKIPAELQVETAAEPAPKTAQPSPKAEATDQPDDTTTQPQQPIADVENQYVQSSNAQRTLVPAGVAADHQQSGTPSQPVIETASSIQLAATHAVAPDSSTIATMATTNEPTSGFDQVTGVDSLSSQRGIAEPAKAGASTVTLDTTKPDFAQKLSAHLQTAAESGKPLRIRLNPPELGTLQIEVGRQAGQAVARIEVESAAAKSIITEQLHLLRDSLQQQGLKLDRLDVEVNEQLGQQQTAKHDQQQNRSGHQEILWDGEDSSTAATKTSDSSDEKKISSSRPSQQFIAGQMDVEV